MRLAAIVALLVIAACDGAPGDLAWPVGPEGARRGSRLRPLFLDDGDGTRVQLGFHDEERGEDCTFWWRMGMHESWCLPAWSSRELVYYRDPACTEPLIDAMDVHGARYVGRTLTWDESCQAGQLWPESGWSEPPLQPPTRPDLYRVGAEIAPETIYGGVDQCGPAHTTQRWRELERVELDEFVAGTPASEGSGRMQELAIIGADGSRQPIWLHDGELDALCSSVDFGDEPAACAPAAVHTDLGQERDTLFADPGCTSLLFPVETACDSWQPSWGELGETFYRLAGEVSVTDVYSAVGDFCIRLSPRTDTRYVRAGPPVTTDQLVTGQRVAIGSGGRLESYASLVGDLETRVGQSTLLDRELAVECRPGAATDLATRCIPTAHARTFHLDDCGSSTVDAVQIAGPPPPLAALPLPVGSGDGPAYEVHRLGEPLPVGMVLTWQDDAAGPDCQSISVSTDAAYYQLGDVVPPDQLVELREVME